MKTTVLRMKSAKSVIYLRHVIAVLCVIVCAPAVSNAAPAATPTFSPAAGTYSSSQTVSISDSTSGSTIYYTTDGSTPTTSSNVYSGAIIVSSTETLNAIAVASGYTTSATGSATYTFGGASAPAYVQQCNIYSVDTTSLSCTLNGVGAGHALLIGIYGPSTLTSVTSSSGTPTSVISNQTVGGGDDVSAYILSNTASGGITITANVSGEQNMWLTVVEYSNVAASPLDASASGANMSYASHISTSNFTTTAASDMLWSLCSAPSGSSITVGTSPITWNQVAIATGADNPVVLLEDGVAGSAGSYSGRCTVDDSETNIITVALKGGGTPAAATPTFSPAAGTYSSAQTVTISDSTSGATIYYTTNGTTPTTSSTQYTGAITVSSTETLEAIATASGYSQSAVGSAAYTINSSAAATPTFSPAAGTYSSPQTVSISDSTSGSTIYYTTNGTTPTTSSTHYTGAITVSSTETLEAIATASGYTQSAVGSAAYTINSSAAATPSFSPAAGTYSSAQTVTISDSISGATIYYTTDGSTPTTSSNVYSGAITVSSTETLNAIAVASGYTTSATGSATYTIGGASAPAYVQQCNIYSNDTTSLSCTLNGVGAGHALLIGIYEPSTLTSVTSSSGMPTSIISNQTLGSGSDVSAYILSNTTSGSITITANVSIEQHMWLTVVEYSNVAASPLDASAGGASTSYESTISTSNFTTTAASDMLWSLCSAPSGSPIAVGTSPITWNQVAIATGSYPPVVMVEDGVAGSAGSYSGQCTVGDSDTNIVTVALKGGGTPAAATPTFSPAAGTYSTAQTVTISDSTSGSTIYYTTNGTTPTTSSTQYTGAITVSSTETLESIATASGYSQSAVGSAAYTINSSGTIPTLSVSTSGTPSTYGGSVTFTATISSGPTGSITFYDSGVSVGSGTISGTTASYTTSTLAVGTHTITAGYAGGSGYNAVTSSAITQVVNQATQTITFGTLPGVTYGVSPITLGATASSGLAVSYSVTGPATVSGSTLTVTGTGSVTVTASQAGNSNYSAATSVQRTFAVAQAALTVTANNASRVYGASNPTFSYTITGYVNGDTSSVVSGTATETTTATTSSAVGTYPITFATESLTATNYTFSYVSGTLTISGGAMQTITFTALSSPVTYGVSPIALSASASSGLAVTFSVVSGPGTISGSTLTITGAGTVVVAANQGGNSNYAAATQVTQSVVVNQATQTITFGTLPGVTYGVSPITLGATASSGLTVSYTVTGPATVSGSTLTVTGAGSVTVTASQAGNSNYAAATSVQQSFTVAQAPLTVTANNASRAYGAANPAFSYTITGYVNGDTSGVVSGTAMETTTATTSSALGTYPITFATESLSATNYTFSYVGGTLTVSGAVATLTLSTSGTPVLYGGSVTFTATLSISSSGDTVTFRDGSTAIGAGTIQGTTATFTPDPTTPLTAGPHTISAVWPGNADYSSVTSNSITQTVLSTLNNCLQ